MPPRADHRRRGLNQGEKHFLNLAVRNPNQPGELTDQARLLAQGEGHPESGGLRRAGAGHGAGAVRRRPGRRATPPPLFFDVLPVHDQNDRPDLVAASSDARREAARFISSGTATVYGVIAAGALPGAWLLRRMKNSNATRLGLGVGCLLVAFALGKQARKPRRA